MLVVSSQSRCDICLEPYTVERWPHTIFCGHVFCKSCLLSLERLNCPLCRTMYVRDGIVKLHVDEISATRPNALTEQEQRFRDGITNFVVYGGSGEEYKKLMRGCQEWYRKAGEAGRPDGQWPKDVLDLRATYLLFHNLREMKQRLKEQDAVIDDFKAKSELCAMELLTTRTEAEMRIKELSETCNDQRDTHRTMEKSLRDRFARMDDEWRRRYQDLAEKLRSVNLELSHLKRGAADGDQSTDSASASPDPLLLSPLPCEVLPLAPDPVLEFPYPLRDTPQKARDLANVIRDYPNYAKTVLATTDEYGRPRKLDMRPTPPQRERELPEPSGISLSLPGGDPPAATERHWSSASQACTPDAEYSRSQSYFSPGAAPRPDRKRYAWMDEEDNAVYIPAVPIDPSAYPPPPPIVATPPHLRPSLPIDIPGTHEPPVPPLSSSDSGSSQPSTGSQRSDSRRPDFPSHRTMSHASSAALVFERERLRHAQGSTPASLPAKDLHAHQSSSLRSPGRGRHPSVRGIYA